MSRGTNFIVALVATVMLATFPAIARDLSKEVKKTRIAVEAVFACGVADKANCSIVAESIKRESAAFGLNLELGNTEGSGQSADAVCQDFAHFAVGQGDTFSQYLTDRRLKCIGKLVKLPIEYYLYSLYVVVPASASYDSLSAMAADAARANKPLTIAAGREGSGGQDTMGAVARLNPDLNISLTYDGGKSALSMVSSRQIAALAIMDAPDSELVANIKNEVNPTTKKPAFKFLKVDLPYSFFEKATDFAGKPLYRKVTIPLGGLFGWSDILTIGTPATSIVSKSFYDREPDAVRAFLQGIERAQGAINAGVKAKN